MFTYIQQHQSRGDLVRDVKVAPNRIIIGIITLLMVFFAWLGHQQLTISRESFWLGWWIAFAIYVLVLAFCAAITVYKVRQALRAENRDWYLEQLTGHDGGARLHHTRGGFLQATLSRFFPQSDPLHKEWYDVEHENTHLKLGIANFEHANRATLASIVKWNIRDDRRQELRNDLRVAATELYEQIDAHDIRFMAFHEKVVSRVVVTPAGPLHAIDGDKKDPTVGNGTTHT